MKTSWFLGLLILALIASACGTSTEAVPTTPPPGIDGEALLQGRCTRCHNLDRVASHSGNADEWEMTLEDMIGKGATLSEEEKKALADYLSATYPK